MNNRKFAMGLIIVLLLIFNLAIYTVISGKNSMDFKVVELKGDVEVKLPGKDWQPAVKGMVIPEGTQISTGFKSTMKLKSENSHVDVQPLSQITINDNTLENGVYKTHINVKLGKLKAKIDKVGETKNVFKVQTPTAVAGVRGTEEEIGFTPDMGTEIELSEHSADVINDLGEQIVVQQDQNAVIQEDGDMSDALQQTAQDAIVNVAPDAISDDEAAALEDATESMPEMDESDADDIVDELYDDPDELTDIIGDEYIPVFEDFYEEPTGY